jgi:hypothetical protein
LDGFFAIEDLKANKGIDRYQDVASLDLSAAARPPYRRLRPEEAFPSMFA